MSSGIHPNCKSKSTTIILELYRKRYFIINILMTNNRFDLQLFGNQVHCLWSSKKDGIDHRYALAIVDHSGHDLSVKYLVNLPKINMKKHSLTIFQDDDLLYCIKFRAMATWEWQLSQQRLCCKEQKAE